MLVSTNFNLNSPPEASEGYSLRINTKNSTQTFTQKTGLVSSQVDFGTLNEIDLKMCKNPNNLWIKGNVLSLFSFNDILTNYYLFLGLGFISSTIILSSQRMALLYNV